MIPRDDFRKLSAGHFALMTGTDKDSLTKYIEGALFAFDYINKIARDKNNETKENNQDIRNGGEGVQGQ